MRRAGCTEALHDAWGRWRRRSPQCCCTLPGSWHILTHNMTKEHSWLNNQVPDSCSQWSHCPWPTSWTERVDNMCLGTSRRTRTGGRARRSPWSPLNIHNYTVDYLLGLKSMETLIVQLELNNEFFLVFSKQFKSLIACVSQYPLSSWQVIQNWLDDQWQRGQDFYRERHSCLLHPWHLDSRQLVWR